MYFILFGCLSNSYIIIIIIVIIIIIIIIISLTNQYINK